MAELAVGVDIGGTQVKLIAADRTGRIAARGSFATLAAGSSPEAVVGAVVASARDFSRRLPAADRIAGYGFGIPCYAEGDSWVLREVTNLPALEGFPLRPPLEEAFGSSIATTYDTNAAGLAEFLWGAGRGARRMLFMGIGTGISASFFTGTGGMVSYTYQTLGDTGHIIVDPDGGAPCPCGGRGCLEAVASAPAVRQRALEAARAGSSARLREIWEQAGDLTARDAAEAAAAGDEAALAIFIQTGRFIGIALASYLHIFMPDRIVLGGGLSLAGEVLLGPVRRTLLEMGSPWYLRRFEGLVPSHFGQDAGAAGCAALVFYPEIVHPGKNKNKV